MRRVALGLVLGLLIVTGTTVLAGPPDFPWRLPWLRDDEALILGDGQDGQLSWCDADASHHQAWLDLPPSGTLTLAEDACYDTGQDNPGYPVLRIQSEDEAAPDEYWQAGHDGDDCVQSCGNGTWVATSQTHIFEFSNGTYSGVDVSIRGHSIGGEPSLRWGIGSGFEMIMQADAGNDQAIIAMGTGVNQQLIVTAKGNRDYAHGHADTGDPVQYWHSSRDPRTGQQGEYDWAAETHDQSNNVHAWAAGVRSFDPTATAIPAIRLPRVQGINPSAPVTCAAGYVGSLYYVDDTDDGGPGATCECIAIGDDGAGTPNDWDWVQVDTGAEGICP